MKETSVLLRPFAVPQVKKSPTYTRTLILGGTVAAVLFVAGAFYVGKNGMVYKGTALDEGRPTNDPDSYGWYFYKTAMVTKNGTSSEALRFMRNFTGGYDCVKTPLGCDGYKVTCEYGTNLDDADNWDRQIHYVHAPRLFSKALDNDNMGVDGWQDVTESSMEDMDKQFSAFLHNKLQMYISAPEERAQLLEGAGYKVMRRLSYWRDTETLLAHVSTQMSGKVWEFVGLAPSDTTLYQFWSDDECPAAHKIDGDVETMEKYLAKINQDTEYDITNTSFWISTQIAASVQNSEERSVMMQDLQDLTSPQIVYDNSDSCSVTTVSYKNTDENTMSTVGDQVTLKFVENAKFQEITVDGVSYSLKMYEDYIRQVHVKYLKNRQTNLRRDAWRNWDHWLDQHVGIKWKEDDGCYDHSKAVTSRMLDNDTPVGKRAINGDGDHYYVGYEGTSMSLEYNTEQCHYGVGETDTCTCNHYNSNELGVGMSSDSICLHDDIY